MLLALGVSYGVARLASEVIDAVLQRFVSRQVGEAFTKYLGFAIVVVGIASRSRVRLLEDFMGAPAYNRDTLNAQLTQELWVVAMYHTIVDSLEGIAWLFVIVGLILLAALIIASTRRSRNCWPTEMDKANGKKRVSEHRRRDRSLVDFRRSNVTCRAIRTRSDRGLRRFWRKAANAWGFNAGEARDHEGCSGVAAAQG